MELQQNRKEGSLLAPPSSQSVVDGVDTSPDQPQNFTLRRPSACFQTSPLNSDPPQLLTKAPALKRGENSVEVPLFNPVSGASPGMKTRPSSPKLTGTRFSKSPRIGGFRGLTSLGVERRDLYIHDERAGVGAGEAKVEEKPGEIAFSAIPHSKLSQSTQSGFTIIESLLAMMIVTILLVGISPLLVLSTASRVQARRIDLATQAARSYVDALRANAILPPGRDNADFTAVDLGVPAPPNIPNQVRNPRTCLDKNLQPLVPCNNPAFVIQAFRDPLPNGGTDTDRDGTTQTEAQQQGYCLGLRVYRGDAFGGGNAPDQIKPLPSMFTETANTKEYPLVVMVTQITNRTSFEQYQNRFPDHDNDPTTPRQARPQDTSSCQ